VKSSTLNPILLFILGLIVCCAVSALLLNSHSNIPDPPGHLGWALVYSPIIPLLGLILLSLFLKHRFRARWLYIPVAFALLFIGYNVAFEVYGSIPTDYNPTYSSVSRSANQVVIQKPIVGGWKTIGTLHDNDAREFVDSIHILPRYPHMSFVCGCRGNPRIQLFDNSTLILEFTIHHGYTLRCKRICDDSDLKITKEGGDYLVQVFKNMKIEEYTKKGGS
jgi:hypothetical protein